jgi:hypothetical protein
MENLRTPFLIAALVLIAVAVLVEAGSLVLPDTVTPGLGIPSLALLHSLVLFAALLLGAGLLIPERIHGRAQGISTLIVAVLVLLAALGGLFESLGKLILMVTLLMSPPFGTLAYFAKFEDFSRGAASVTLSFLMTLELAFAVCLVLAQQRFLQNKSLVLLVVTALLGTVIISLLHGLVPGFLVSITDAIGAIVVAILAAVWAIILIVLSIPGIVRAARVDRAA